VEEAVSRFSSLGEHSRLWLTAGTLGAALHTGRRGVYVRLVLTVSAAEVVNALVKMGIDRPRPALADLPPLMSTRSPRSFPSAHATTSFAAARLLAQAVPAAPVYVVAGAMALSRPYVGVHYPSDVLAGMALGTVLAGALQR
jgi:membrane-associated phospholipid phosphatase